MNNLPLPFQRLDQTRRDNYARSDLIRRALWQIVQATLFSIPITRLWGWRRFLLTSFGAQLGHRAGVHPSTRILHPWLLQMGDWTMIGPRTRVYNLGQITIGDQTVVSQDVDLCAGTHDYTEPTLSLLKPTITIGAGVWIAAGAFIGPGAVIGANSVVGARAVVTGTIPQGVVAAGNPCKIIKAREMKKNATAD